MRWPAPNGKLLEWTEASPVAGNPYWVIKIAHFNVDSEGQPYITDVQTLSPGGYFGQEFSETGGFSADSSTMLFTSDFQTRQFRQDQIYSLNLATGTVTRLTAGTRYNERPRFTPSGQIIWMSNACVPLSHPGGTEWWTMNSDGSGPQKLSYFNSPESPEYFGRTVYVGSVNTYTWSADGSTFLGDRSSVRLGSWSRVAGVVPRRPLGPPPSAAPQRPPEAAFGQQPTTPFLPILALAGCSGVS